jgi:hypothetical protein
MEVNRKNIDFWPGFQGITTNQRRVAGSSGWQYFVLRTNPAANCLYFSYEIESFDFLLDTIAYLRQTIHPTT